MPNKVFALAIPTILSNHAVHTRAAWWQDHENSSLGNACCVGENECGGGMHGIELLFGYGVRTPELYLGNDRGKTPNSVHFYGKWEHHSYM
ncbi:predicted protein [Sclerotinia sclerotiorum 1980 UF-70]|uniref:Uncharacterized protein n=1 Tax=Sclerotinia sclerotiorum (strain ATCC 18683 / 1980 / Ss-1) TaxID=665079 RepID=A7EWP9_SCLS1|nr:predicted protein [Sclerotinia sclerotiorum 1980 UF-70]EDN93891.1 predicted protein [Sclerotinia sclerotiorum 1980 UF-70]